MTMTPQQLWDAALTLENDGEFYKEYTNYASAGTPLADGRRTIISRYLAGRKLTRGEVEDREQLRRYLDNTWQMPAARHGAGATNQAVAGLDTIEFWKDEVRFPKKEVTPPAAQHLPLEPGAAYWKYRLWEGLTPAMHGALYTNEDIVKLVTMFYNGYDAPTIAHELKRKHNGIASKLKELRLLTFCAASNTWCVPCTLPSVEEFFAARRLTYSLPGTPAAHYEEEVKKAYRKKYPDAVAFWDQKAPQLSDITADPELDAQPTHTLKETTMPIAIDITTKTLINGNDIAELKDSQIYTIIAEQEAEIKKLEAIENKPKRLVAEIEKRQAGIKALVDHLDGKESKPA